MEACDCNLTLNNSGAPNCVPLIDVTNKIIVVPLFDKTGARNQIDLTSTLDKSYFDALINNADGSKRWYPLPELENVEDVRADTEFETSNSGQKYKVRKGIRTFTGHIFKGSTDYQRLIDTYGCKNIGVYFVDNQGQLIGDRSFDGFLSPIPVSKGSWDSMYVPATDSTVPKLKIMFDFEKTFADSDMGYVTSASDIDLRDLEGLVSIFGEIVGSVTTTSFSAKITTDFGNLQSQNVVAGLVLADFELNNLTTPAVITILTLTESPDGTYAFTYAAQTSGDELQLSIASATLGYGDEGLEAMTITTP